MTVNGAMTYDGTSSLQGYLSSDQSGVTRTLTVANATTFNWLLVQMLTKAGAGSITVNNGFNGGGLTSITVNPPTGGARIIGG
jgi:hypothetical protein